MRLSSQLEELPMTTNNLRALDAYDSGFDDGKHEGYDDGYLDAENECDKKIEELEYQIEDLKDIKVKYEEKIELLEKKVKNTENIVWHTAQRILGDCDDFEDCFASKILYEAFGDEIIGDSYDNIIIKLSYKEVNKKLRDAIKKYNKDNVFNFETGDIYEYTSNDRVQLLMFIDRLNIYDENNWILAINEKGLMTSLNIDDKWPELTKCTNQDEAKTQLVAKLRQLM